jgi:hypothetical protein
LERQADYSSGNRKDTKRPGIKTIRPDGFGTRGRCRIRRRHLFGAFLL